MSLNEAPEDEAESLFFACCGSQKWARKMADARPFPLLESFFDSAEQNWLSLSLAERLETFTAGPQTENSEFLPLRSVRPATGHTGTAAAPDSVYNDLAEATAAYEDKFGLRFIVSTETRSDTEILAICRARFRNSRQTEINIAGEEQLKILIMKLESLLRR